MTPDCICPDLKSRMRADLEQIEVDPCPVHDPAPGGDTPSFGLNDNRSIASAIGMALSTNPQPFERNTP